MNGDVLVEFVRSLHIGPEVVEICESPTPAVFRNCVS
jgi:hypothetical protein